MLPNFRPLHQLPKPIIRRRNLPHWEIGGATYFLTYRLADALPAGVLRELETVCEAWLRHHDLRDRSEVKKLSPLKRQEFRKVIREREEQWLDAKHGTCILRDARIREPVIESLREFDGKRYCLDGFVVMPNHVHLLVLPLAGWSLSEIIGTWKKFSARRINDTMDSTGAVWLEETHDHIVREAYELSVYRRYISENPVKARLRVGEYELGCGSGILI
jgi:REP element-mobilizing transposase RayT